MTYKRWYFGHYHSDGDIEDAHGGLTLLYRDILRLGERVGKEA